MRVLLRLAVVVALGITTACTQKGPRVGSTERISCDSFFDKQSALAQELAASESAPKCERKFGPQGGYYEAFGIAGTADRNTVPASRVMIIIFRYYNWNKPLEPMESKDFPDAENFTVLLERIPVNLVGATEDGRIAHFFAAKAKMTFVCVSANTVNANGSRSLVEFCRATKSGLDDDGITALAQEIANQDLAAIRP